MMNIKQKKFKNLVLALLSVAFILNVSKGYACFSEENLKLDKGNIEVDGFGVNNKITFVDSKNKTLKDLKISFLDSQDKETDILSYNGRVISLTPDKADENNSIIKATVDYKKKKINVTIKVNLSESKSQHVKRMGCGKALTINYKK